MGQDVKRRSDAGACSWIGNMTRLFSNTDLRGLSLIVAIAMLLTALPVFSAVSIVTSSGRPEITNNICHPIQASECAPETTLARPAVGLPDIVLCDFGPTALGQTARLGDFKIAPDTPPPKISL